MVFMTHFGTHGDGMTGDGTVGIDGTVGDGEPVGATTLIGIHTTGILVSM